MKNLLKIVLGILLTFGFLQAELLEQKGQKDGFDIKLSSPKALIVGKNDFVIELSKDSKVVDNAKVKIKFFMPEMPGMPYMETEENAVLIDGKYKVSVNISMGGTWQYQLKFKASDEVVHTVKGSVNF